MNNLFQDLRYGIRMLARRPGFTFVAILTLALGTGATTAIFSVVNAVSIRALPYPQPDRLMLCGWQFREAVEPMITVTSTQAAFFQANSTSFEETAAYTDVGRGLNLAGSGEPLRVRGMRVSESFFRTLGVGPRIGRGFTVEEDRPDGPKAVILSDGLWRAYFAADPEIAGKNVQVDGETCEVAGVLPADFHFESAVDVVMPLRLKPNPKDGGHNTEMIARLAPGVSLSQAQAEMDQLLEPFRQSFPSHIGPNERGIKLIPYRDYIIGDVSKTLLILFGAVGFVLLIACVNVANLLLARAASRNSEMAIRTALGASRSRLVRQLLTESVMLALAGGAGGLLVALWGVPALLQVSPGNLPRASEIGVDYQAVIFALAASLLTSLLFGIVPALRASRLDINQTLKASSNRTGTGKTDSRLRGLLVVSEVALAVVLLVGAALLIKSFTRLRSVDMGFNPDNLTTMQVSLTSAEYKTTAASWNFQQQVIERIERLPGVNSVATSVSLPLERSLNNYVHKAGDNDGRSVESRPISPKYFDTLGMTLLGGRAFDDRDSAANTPVAIVNKTLARKFWSEGDAIGSLIVVSNKQCEIIGVVGDINDQGFDQPVAPTIYLPMSQLGDGEMAAYNRWFLTTWIVRTSAAVDLSAELRAAIKSVDSKMPVANVRSMSDVMTGSIAAQRFIMTLMGIFAALALVLTAIGIYGVLSYQVSQRTHEIGIRIALGARPGDVIKLVVGQGMLLAAIGIAVGIFGAYALTGLMKSLLFEVSHRDTTAFVVISVLLGLAAFLASYIPARRATRVDPMIALRYE